MRFVPIFVIFAAAALVVAVSGAGASARATCTEGVHPFGGANARTFCGRAKASLTIGKKTFTFTGGECERGAQYVSLNIGTIVLGTTTRAKPDYFGLLVGKAPVVGGVAAAHDGSFKAQAVSGTHAGKGYAVISAQVTLTHGRTRGTFAGKLLTGGTARGTFSCG